MQTIYAAMRDRLVVATGDDEDLRTTERLTDHDLECVAASPDVPDRAFCGTFGDGLYRSTDGGDTWARVGGDVLEPKVMAVAVSPHDPAEVWVGTEPSRVYRSTDGGESWTERPGLTELPSADRWSFPPRPDTHHVRWVEVDPHEPERLYVGIEAGALVLTDDGGGTWQDHPEGARRDNHTLATHPEAEGRVYAAAGDGYAESPDAGETWIYPQSGLGHRYVWGLAVDPADPDRMVVSAARGARTAHDPENAEAHVYRRSGDPWDEVEDGLPPAEGTVRSVLVAPGPGTFYALNNRGLYRSTDGGETWRGLDVAWPDPLERQTSRGLAVV